MSDAVAVGDNQGRPIVGLGLNERVEGLLGRRAHRDLRDVDIPVSDRHQAEILFRASLAGRRKLGHSRARRRLRGLSTGIRIDLGVEHQDVDVAPGREHVIEAAIADVVRPAVATDNPHALADERRRKRAEPAGARIVECLEGRVECSHPRALRLHVIVRRLRCLHDLVHADCLELRRKIAQELFGFRTVLIPLHHRHRRRNHQPSRPALDSAHVTTPARAEPRIGDQKRGMARRDPTCARVFARWCEGIRTAGYPAIRFQEMCCPGHLRCMPGAVFRHITVIAKQGHASPHLATGSRRLFAHCRHRRCVAGRRPHGACGPDQSVGPDHHRLGWRRLPRLQWSDQRARLFNGRTGPSLARGETIETIPEQAATRNAGSMIAVGGQHQK